MPVPMPVPQLDPTPFFELTRAHLATELFVAGVFNFDVCGRLAKEPKARVELAKEIGLAERPAQVLFTALQALNVIQGSPKKATAPANVFELTPVGREFLISGAPLEIRGYVGLASESPGVKGLVENLKSNRPLHAQDDKGAAFIYRDGMKSAMEQETAARQLTLALAGRAKICSTSLAQTLDAAVNEGGLKTLLDIGGGTGLYSIACLQRFPKLRAIVWDRPEVLKVADEFGREYGVSDRLELRSGDMFADPIPQADAHLLSNVLHDWDVPECRKLVMRSAEALARGGRVLVHDVFLNDALDGPLGIALYSTALYTLTEGRAYSAAEYSGWLQEAGFETQPIMPTNVNCGVLTGVKK